MADQIKSIRRKISITTISGYRCAVCQTETVTHDGTVATVCLDCGAPNPVLAWKNIVKDTTEVEVISF